MEGADFIVLFPANVQIASEEKKTNANLMLIAKPDTILHDS